MEQINPIIKADFPDPDVIRVGDTYYMISTTMHFFPGGIILRSYDLVHWEFVSYVFDRLESTDAECLQGEQSIYGKGMWAASLRYHSNKFYVCFSAYDVGKTYLFTADEIIGPWKRHYIEGVYHHNSLLFDDDGRTYVTWGMDQIHLTELNEELTAPRQGGLDRIIVEEKKDVYLGYEGSHFYKINGRYYLFLIHWPKQGKGRRTQACFYADHLTDTFVGGDVFEDDNGYSYQGIPQGIAQGGIVETPEGKWYSVMFQDHGAAGRMPVLVPITWIQDENSPEGKLLPVFGENGKQPKQIEVVSTRPNYRYEPLFSSDIFEKEDEKAKIHPAWQWNHEPDDTLWNKTEDGGLAMKTDKICVNVVQAVNTLTQRMMYPTSSFKVRVDASKINNGDYAGVCALQGCYGWIGIAKEMGCYFIVMYSRKMEDTSMRDISADYMPGTEVFRAPFDGNCVEFKVRGDFTEGRDVAEFYYRRNRRWIKAGEQKLVFKLDHFMGCRYGMFLYSTVKSGGEAVFWDSEYRCLDE